MPPAVLAPSEWTRKATALLRLEEIQIARRPVAPPSDDPSEERRRIAGERRATRVLWHATTEGAESAPIAEWDDCGATEKTAGSWAKGSGWYRLVCDDDDSIQLVTHYRVAGDREDTPRTPGDPSGSRARAEDDLWKRLRVEGADRYAELREVRQQLRDANNAISTHLTTIAQKDARILALEEAQVPTAEAPHWATPVAVQLAGYLEEARPMLGPLVAEMTPAVRAAVQDHLSQGAHTAKILARLGAAQFAFKLLLDSVRDAGGFALLLPEPTAEQIGAHHCPHPGCSAERSEPCMDGEMLADEPHEERIALARLPRDLKVAIKKSGAQLVPAGSIVSDDAAVLDAAKALCIVLEMDAWQEAQDAAAVKALDPSPAYEPAPTPTPPPPDPIVPPPPAAVIIPNDETEEESEPGDLARAPTEPPPPKTRLALVKLETPEAREEFSASVARRKEIERAQERVARRILATNAKKDAEAKAKTPPEEPDPA